MIIEKSTNQIIIPTRFSDKTCQVWKLGDIEKPDIWWYYEGDHEIMVMRQLIDLLTVDLYPPPKIGIMESMIRQPKRKPLRIVCPWMPYGRQDKKIANDSTFALQSFMNMFPLHMVRFVTLDMHSEHYAVRSISPIPLMRDAFYRVARAKVLVFPDKGAENRYGEYFYDDDDYHTYAVTMNKVRDQSTGRITSMDFSARYDANTVDRYHCMVVDDICDGGATFIMAAKRLLEAGARGISLFTTHGIYSKGLDILFNAGYDSIVTTNSRYQKVEYTADSRFHVVDGQKLLEEEIRG